MSLCRKKNYVLPLNQLILVIHRAPSPLIIARSNTLGQCSLISLGFSMTSKSFSLKNKSRQNMVLLKCIMQYNRTQKSISSCCQLIPKVCYCIKSLKEYYLHMFREKKRMQQDLREFHDSWTDLSLSMLLFFPHKKWP